MGTMAHSMRLFLIRHGETVDNVAQVYAGSRDSALTNHGFEQANRLGQHLASEGLRFTHIFSSHLQRAFKTAGKIRDAQVASAGAALQKDVPEVVQVPAIMEQDFGFYEGKKWYNRPTDSMSSGKEHHWQEHKDIAGFVDIESKESLAQRVDMFLDHRLLSLLRKPTETAELVVAVVSHGITLSMIWRRLLLRLPSKSVAFSPEVFTNSRGVSLEHLGGWSNTGYLELHMQWVASQEQVASGDVVLPSTSKWAPSKDVVGHAKAETAIPDVPRTASGNSEVSETDVGTKAVSLIATSSPCKLPQGWTTMIQAVNGRDHLKGLKRTGGGVGSARHDASQTDINTFFKRRKVE